MDHARHLVFVFRFNGNAVPVIPHGDYGILQVAAAGAVDHGYKLGMDLIPGDLDGTAHMLKPRAGVVGYFFL